jgi:hypothetical protein
MQACRHAGMQESNEEKKHAAERAPRTELAEQEKRRINK